MWLTWLKLSRTLFLVAVLSGAAWPVCGQTEDKREVAYAQRHYNLGKKLYLAGKTDAAIAELYEALSVRELYPDAQLLLGRCLFKLKRYREAAVTLKGIARPHLHSTDVQALLGEALYHTNKLREASKALNFAIVLTRRPNPALHYILGLIYLRQAEPERAMREAKAALDLNPRFHVARKLLSDAYVINNDLARAEEELTRYLRTVRAQNDVLPLKERLEAISTLRQAKDWQALPSTVTPPRILDIPKPKYTDEAFRNRVEGTVKLEVLFGSNAEVKQVMLVRGLGFGLDERAIEAARAITFTPGESEGKPVPIWTGVVMNFVLEDAEKQRKSLTSKFTAQ